MPHTPETLLFLDRLTALPPGPHQSLDHVLQPSLDHEAELRRLFATDRSSPRLADKYVGLVDIFDAPDVTRTTRARVVQGDLSTKYVMPLPDARRRQEGEPAIVSSLAEFHKNWSIFSEGSLSQLTDWSNVVAAGGSVLACLTPLPESAKNSKRATRKYYHGEAYPSSDIDLFLYGLTPDEAEIKINKIYEAVRDSIPWDCTCVRSKHTVSIHSQYPYRSIQIVLRLYQSPAEILAGFDVDAPCCLYDGSRVLANPRAIVAIMRQCNTIDISRRSPSYEVRLSKYSARGFEVYVPGLRRQDIDPTIYERAISRVHGLARLLVLEKLRDVDSRDTYLGHRRSLRSRPPSNAIRRMTARHKGDLKSVDAALGLQMNDYDVGSLHIPYGPAWDARAIEKLIYQTDLGMNSPFNPRNKNRRLHRHTAWFGTMAECLEDLCAHCPDPLDDKEKALQGQEDSVYIRGRVRFIQDDPGRQSITGSFNPIDIGEWTEDAYIGDTAKFFNAIVSYDRATVLKMIQDGSANVNRRDHVGRTPLHVAALVKAVDIACDLIDNGARISARVVDGRTALHMAARLDLPVIIKKLLTRSMVNSKNAKIKSDNTIKAIELDKDAELDSDNSEEEHDDDDGDHLRSKVKSPHETPEGDGRDNAVIPEDEDEAPDVLDVNIPDWDLSWPPLFHAVAAGSLLAIEELLVANADVKVLSKFVFGIQKVALHPLTLAILTEGDECAIKVVERLLQAGATSTVTDENMLSIFHRFVRSGRTPLVSALLHVDPNSQVAVNFPAIYMGAAVFPLVSALNNNSYPIVALLLAHGAKMVYVSEDLSRVRSAIASGDNVRLDENFLKAIVKPVETAIANTDPIVEFLVKMGSDENLKIRQGLVYTWSSASGVTYLDWIKGAILNLDERLSYIKAQNVTRQIEDLPLGSENDWKANFVKLASKTCRTKAEEKATRSSTIFKSGLSAQDDEEGMINFRDYLRSVETLIPGTGTPAVFRSRQSINDKQGNPPPFHYHYVRPGRYDWGKTIVSDSTSAFDELFQACWDGDNTRIQQLCFPNNAERKRVDPLEITVQVVWLGELTFTTLYVAIHRRRWETARLIMAIAAAQYKAEDKKVVAVKSRDIALDDDSDGDMESEDEDYWEEPRDINFIDIASRPSTVHTKFSPERLLDAHVTWVSENGSKTYSGSLLYQAIVQDDWEAFVEICDLYKLLPPHDSLRLNEIATWITIFDRPEMLDYFIRQTGVGVEVDDQVDEVHSDPKLSSSPGWRVYLGLTVHGKKRSDLATRGANPKNQNDMPIVMRAAMNGANDILKYLHGQRPLAAYQYFASTNGNDSRAQRLQKIADLPAALPQLLGWTINILNESPLTAAVIKDKLDTVKVLFSLSPKLMERTLRSRIKFCGFSILLIAVYGGCSPELFDFLLSLKVPLTDVDNRGWNIYHIASARAHKTLIAHMLETLPEDITSMLLAQQSKPDMDTPLHLAVKASRFNIVKLLSKQKNSRFTIRDVNGFTPLYSAVSAGFAGITRVLCQVSPKETLYMENAVGDTIPETAVQLDMYHRAHITFPGNMEYIREMDHNGPLMRPSFVVKSFEEKEQNVTQLRNTLNELLADGCLNRGTQLADQLLDFTQKMEAYIASHKTKEKVNRAKDEEDDTESDVDPVDHVKTAQHIRDFAASTVDSQHTRDLIHIFDVHLSVEYQTPTTKATPNSKVTGVGGGVPECGGLYAGSNQVNHLRSLVSGEVIPYIDGSDMHTAHCTEL